jgi:hypothetical protein
MTPKRHVRFGGGLGEKEHRYLARSLPYCEACWAAMGSNRQRHVSVICALSDDIRAAIRHRDRRGR